MSRRVVPFALVVLLAPVIAGCVGGKLEEERVGGPGFDIGNVDFYHSYYANNETFTDVFTWENPTGKAHLEVRHDLKWGSERVVLEDANGTRVFVQEFWKGTRDGQYHPREGDPGEWTITIERRDVTGQFDLHVWRGE